MSIIRSNRPDNGYLMASNTVLREERLSYRALGLLLHMLSHADGWVFRSDDLARESYGSGRDSVQKAMRELAEFGYLVTTKKRNPDGTFNTTTTVYDVPKELPARELAAPVSPSPLEDHPKKTIKDSDQPSAAAVDSPQQIAAEYYEANGKLANFMAIRGLVTKALNKGETPDMVRAALQGCTDAGFPVTASTLTVQLNRIRLSPQATKFLYCRECGDNYQSGDHHACG